MGGTYLSARLSVRGSPAIGRFRKKSTVGGRFWPSAVDFGYRRSIEGEIDRRRSIEEEKGKKKRKRIKKKRRRKNTSPARCRGPRVACVPSPLAGCLRAVVACGLPARRRRPRIARNRGRFFPRARRRSISPRGEKDRGD
ncbi:hypothetical protein BHE74_00031666, partial [Ensete ventricosum]